MEKIQYQKYFNEDEISIGQAFKIVLTWVVYILLGALLLAMVLGVQIYTVVGWSMQPTIDYKSIVFVVDDKDVYEIDDIISFQFAGAVNTHRIIDIEYNEDGSIKHYITKGDNPYLESQEYIVPTRVLGRVITIGDFVFTIPYIGNVILFLQENIVDLILIIIAGYIYFNLTPRKEDYMRYNVYED